MMPLDNSTVLDAVMTGWSRRDALPDRRSPVHGDATDGPGGGGEKSQNTSGTGAPVLDAGSVDALLGDLGMPGSLLDFNGNGLPIKKKR